MKTYNVQWSIDITAESAREAVEMAREIQLDPESYATVFRVMEPNDDGDMVDVKVIDLEESIEEP